MTVASVFAYITVDKDLKAHGTAGEIVLISINDGDLLSDVAVTLKAQALIGEPFIFETYAKYKKITDFKVGVYKIDRGWGALTILKFITDASNAEKNDVAMTIIPGDWAKDVAKTIADLSDFTVEEILAQWNNVSYFEALDADYTVLTSEANTKGVRVLLEGYLMPETYFVNPTWSIDQFTRRILDHTERFYVENKAAFDASKYTIHQLFILSSIVQFEASKEADMKMVAQVFYNRMDLPMRLQSSVTVCYALYEYTDWRDCESNSTFDSPYNTYKVDGLPIGPIDNPSATAIKATLNPTPNDYYYFLADVYGDGTVYYAKTYAQHQKNVEKYLK